MEWGGGGGGGGGGVSPARWCEESGDSEEVQFELGDLGMGTEDDHEDDAESCTGGDEEEEEEEMMQGDNGRDQRRSTVLVDNAWRSTWFHPESCCSSSCDQEINGGEQCVRSVCVDQDQEHSVHQIQDNRLFWETCLAVGY